MIDQYDLDPAVVISKLHDQAANIGRSLPGLLRTLSKGIPNFAEMIARDFGIDLSDVR